MSLQHWCSLFWMIRAWKAALLMTMFSLPVPSVTARGYDAQAVTSELGPQERVRDCSGGCGHAVPVEVRALGGRRVPAAFGRAVLSAVQRSTAAAAEPAGRRRRCEALGAGTPNSSRALTRSVLRGQFLLSSRLRILRTPKHVGIKRSHSAHSSAQLVFTSNISE